MSLQLDLSGLGSLKQTSSVTAQAKNSYLEILKGSEYGFYELNQQTHLLKQCQKAFSSFRHIEHFVQIGIGGSSLGAELLIKSLKGSRDCDFTFINNVDTDIFAKLFNNLELSKTLFYFVSKSGGTVETIAALAVISNYLKDNGISEETFSKHMVFATDPSRGDLRELSQKLNITCLDIPSNVGGRFSVLSPVGLFPALFKGLHCQDLLDGAEQMKDQLQNPDFFELASTLRHGKDRGFSQTVLMPYSSSLRILSDWFVQLWAESLGKKKDIHGKDVFTGLTPLPSYGATDQHSQVQLFVEGPYDKVTFFIEVEKREDDYLLENSFNLPSMLKIKNHSLEKLLKAELEGTKKAFLESNRPFVCINVEQLNEKSLGALILFFECLTVMTGILFEIDPFDQPGVEAGKKFAFEWLEKLK